MINDVVVFLITGVSTSFGSWFLSNIYVHICAHPSLTGLILSPLYLGSPICRSLAYFQYELSDIYTRLWFSFTVAITKKYVS